MTESILVTGAGGQLGQELQATVDGAANVRFTSRAELDIGDKSATLRFFEKLKPTVVINAAAYTNVDGAESDIESATRVNATGARNLVDCCLPHGTHLIQLSTDFVFGEGDGGTLTPDSPTGPLGVYGETKLAGEQAVRRLGNHATVVRVSWLYSEFGNNFVKTMLRLMAERDELRIVSDQVGAPTWAHGLAEFCWLLALQRTGGVYHYSDAGRCSWFEFACEIQRIALQLELLSKPVKLVPISAEEYGAPARRPSFSVLNCDATMRDFDWRPLDWRDNLRKMMERYRNGT